MRLSSILLAAIPLGACAQLMEGPSVAGYPGLQWQLQSFYGARALEENAMCTRPQMTAVTGYQIVEDTPERVVMNVRYHYRDEGAADFDDDEFGFPRFRFGTGSCDSWAQRTFVLAKAKGGQPSPSGRPQVFVQSMTGPQRELPPGSVMQ
jgi:hypothetical protein